MAASTIPTFTARRADLIRAVAIAARATERRTTIPILADVKLTRTADRLEIVGTNLDTEIKATMTVSDGLDGSTCIPAARLLAILGALGEDIEEVFFSERDTGRVTMKAGSVEATFLVQPSDEFPTLSLTGQRWAAPLPEGAVSWLFGGVAEAASLEETRYYLNGVCFSITDGEAVTVATDGHRLLSRTMKLPAATRDVAPVIVSTGAVRHMIAMAGRGESELRGYSATLEGNEANRLWFSTAAGPSMTTKPIDGTFPDWRRVVPGNTGAFFEMRAADFRRAMSLARASNDQRGRAVKIDVGENGEASFSVNDPDSVSMTARFPWAGSAMASKSFGANARYLDAMAANLIRLGSKTIRLQMDSPGAPIRMFPDEGITGTTSVVMPMRV